MPTISNLVKKEKMITQKYQRLKRKLLIMIMINILPPAEHFTARLAQGNLVTKTDFDTRLRSLNKINLKALIQT